MSDLLKKIEQLLSRSSDMGLSGNVDLLLGQMDKKKAELLRLCAIPHQFDPAVIRVMKPDLDEGRIEALFGNLLELSIVQGDAGEAALHEGVRAHLFRQWLDPDRSGPFRETSRRLAGYYAGRAEEHRGLYKEQMQQKRMFHLLGANRQEGFGEFRRLIRISWKQYRIGEYETLIHLVREYDPVLDPAHRYWLIYYEARLAAEQHRWDEADSLLAQITANGSPPELLMKARHRSGICNSSRRRWEEAISDLTRALELARAIDPEHDFIDDIMHDLGTVYIRKGDFGRAETYLRQGIELAEEQDDLASMALAYNSLGNLYRKLSDTGGAIEMYQKSLETIERNRDPFRPAQVYNNLGNTYADLADWEKSEEYFRKSLEIKKKAGDTRGQALTLTNLVRVYRGREMPQKAVEASEEAIRLFRSIKDRYQVAQAERNLGKLYRYLDDTGSARRHFGEAIRLFDELDEKERAEQTGIELKALEKQNRRMPWYAWAVIIVFSLIMLFILFLVLLDL